MELEFYGQILEKYSNIKFHQNPSSGCRVVAYVDGQTDRRDEANSSLFPRDFAGKTPTQHNAYF